MLLRFRPRTPQPRPPVAAKTPPGGAKTAAILGAEMAVATAVGMAEAAAAVTGVAVVAVSAEAAEMPKQNTIWSSAKNSATNVTTR